MASEMRELRPESPVYKIDRVLGHGQMASVFRAIREDSQGYSRQVVALKILKNRMEVSALRHEFETLARVRSPHCVRVLGWENLAEGSALVLEWIDGLNLFEMTRLNAIEPECIDEIVAQVQAGLSALEKCGLHHGDLSPANILIDREGCVRIVDFALSPREEGVIRGTSAFLAPEIWNGEPSSFYADLFALGMIEQDLKDGGFCTSTDAEFCRKRMASLIEASQTKSPMLRGDPQDRKMRNLKSSDEFRRQLAESVSYHLDSLAQARVETSVLPLKSRLKKKYPLALRSVLSLIAMLATTAVALSAQAPSGIAQEKTAGLSIRSQIWRELTLNGKPVGFAPLEINGLRAGQHRLSWKSALGVGERIITLIPGEKMKISDAEWTRLDHPRKRN
jgi:serine/threonine protein kinase